MAFNVGGDDDVIADINVTPLVDVVLVLLIIFMVTSSVIARTAFDVPIPTASNAEKKTETPLLSVSYRKVTRADGSVTGVLQVGEENTTITPDALAAKISAIVAKNNREEKKTQVMLSASRDFSYQDIINVIDIIKGAGASSVSLNTRVRESDLPPAP